MKLLTFRHDGAERLGVLVGDRIVDVAAAAAAAGLAAPATMLETIDAGPAGLQAIAAAVAAPDAPSVPADPALLLAPIPRLRKNLFGVGLNYSKHVEETNRFMTDVNYVEPEAPAYFSKPPTAVVGPGAPILLHSSRTKQLDWEAELAVVIGRGGKFIDEASALDHVFGYTIVNDVSARDCRRSGQWLYAKGHDNSAPMGPWVVTRDEIPDPHALDVKLTVNGEIKQDSNTRYMIHKIPKLISDLSHILTLEPGDVIATGTPEGVGYSSDPPQFLNPGDVVEIAIEGIGRIRNEVRLAA